MSVQLTTGAVEDIMRGVQVDKPVLQVLGQKKIAGSVGGSDRYRLLLSDGKHSHSSAMLCTQLNHLITDGNLDNFAVMRLDKYICNTIAPDRRVLILLEVHIITRGIDIGQAKIGNPQPYKAVQQAGGAPTSSHSVSSTTANGYGGGAGPGVQRQPMAPVDNSASNYGSANSSAGAAAAKPTFYNNNSTNQSKPYSVQNVPKTPGGTPAKVHPIASLTPYQNRWTIRARVTSKSGIRTWSNSRGEGKLFSMNLVDESGEIRATAFTNEVDKFYEMIELNKVYYISKATLKTANKQYSSVNNDYEMTFNSDTQVLACEEEVDLPTLSFNFVKINELEKHQPNTVLDVIGVAKAAGDLSTVTGKQSNREIKKRDVTIVDEGKVQIRLTLWGEEAQNFKGDSSPIIAVKGCRLSDWNGRSLSVLSSSQLVLNPDIPEAHRLRGWYDTYGHGIDYEEYRSEGQGAGGGSGTNWKTFSQVKAENLGQGEKADYFSVKATVVFLKKENCMYMACPSSDCNKKVVDQANGMYRCEKCAREYPDYKWRMILSVNLADETDNQWATCFQETAEVILGKPADEVGRMRQEDETTFDNLFIDANFKSYIFKLRAKMETYNEEQRLKTICVQAVPVEYQDYCQKLIGDIETLLQA